MQAFSNGDRPALSAFLRNLGAGLDAARRVIELDGLYATSAAYDYIEQFQLAAGQLADSANEAIERQLQERAR